MAKEEKMLI